MPSATASSPVAWVCGRCHEFIITGGVGPQPKPSRSCEGGRPHEWRRADTLKAAVRYLTDSFPHGRIVNEVDDWSRGQRFAVEEGEPIGVALLTHDLLAMRSATELNEILRLRDLASALRSAPPASVVTVNADGTLAVEAATARRGRAPQRR